MTPKAIRRILATVGVLFLALALPAGSWAQNMFYREVEKNGRIYVFAISKEFENFDKSGEMGKAITKVGYGPNGETMVFDSEDAIGLYNFKHNRPGDPAAIKPEEKKPVMKVSWKDGKTTIETDKAVLNITNRMQVRWTQEYPDSAVTLPGTASPGDSRGSFRLPRARFKLDGWFYKKELEYEIQIDWADAVSALRDLNLNWDVSKDKAFQIKIGQFKVPFGRQELTSSGNQQFVDRSIVSVEFEKGRDVGAQVWGLLAQSKVEWRVGMFNGAGRQRNLGASLLTTNDNDDYQYNARLMFQPFGGDVKYSESDFESTDKLLLAIAGNFERNDQGLTATIVAPATEIPAITKCPCGAQGTGGGTGGQNIKRTLFGGDVSLKYKGFSLMGEYFDRKIEPTGGSNPTQVEFKSNGWHAQAGYLIDKSRHWEVAFRYASWDPSDDISDNDRTEVGGGLNYFYNKHNFKVQSDFRQIKDDSNDQTSKELRIQTQFLF